MSLTSEELETQIEAVQAEFDRQQDIKNNADAELYRLQGEYRVLLRMKEAGSEEATTIKAEPKKETK